MPHDIGLAFVVITFLFLLGNALFPPKENSSPNGREQGDEEIKKDQP